MSNEIKKEESEKIMVEQEERRRTQEALDSQQVRNQEIISSLYWRCRRRSKLLARIFSLIVGVIIVVGFSAGHGLHSTNPIFAWGVIGGVIIVALALFTLANQSFGITIKDIHSWVEKRVLTWFLKREAKSTGIDLREFEGTDRA